MALYIVIEKRETDRLFAQDRAWRDSLYNNPWTVCATLALTGSIGAIVLESSIPRNAVDTGIRLPGLFAWGLLTATVVAIVWATLNYLGVAVALMRWGKLVTFVELSEGGVSLGIRNLWRVGFTWAACRHLRIGRKNVTFTFTGARFHVPAEFLTPAEIELLADYARWTGVRVKG